jgi:DNA-binding IclR family transcriptional regulator
LTRLGYLAYDERTGRYQLGLAAVALGYWGRANMYVRQVAKPLMQEASQALNLCCALGYRDGTDVVYLEHTRGARTLVLGMEPGSRTPLATTAMGRALIAGMQDTERASLLAELERRDPIAWPSTRQRIEASIDAFRQSGYTVSAGEWEAEVHGVGVPLVLPGGHSPMALILGGANYQLKREDFFAQVGPYLVNLAQRIQLKLAQPVQAGTRAAE